MQLSRGAFPDVDRRLVSSILNPFFDWQGGSSKNHGGDSPGAKRRSVVWMLDPFFDWGEDANRNRDGRFPLDVVEKSDAFELTADAPGMAPGDISVEVKDGVLTVKGERNEDEEEKDAEGHVVRAKKNRRHFERRLKLAENVDEEGISATLERGVLTVKVPKVEVTRTEPKRIDVREVRQDMEE